MGPEADGGGDGTGGQASAGGDGRRRLTRALARGAGVGLGVLIATTRLPRRATALAVGGLLGGATAAAGLTGALRDPQEAEEADSASGVSGACARDVVASVATGLLVGAAAAASLWVSLASDAAMEDWLRRRGVRHPRLLAAAVVGAVTAAEGWHETREQETDVPRSPSRSRAPDLAPAPRP